jgi:carboxyl-terminal processing protease
MAAVNRGYFGTTSSKTYLDYAGGMVPFIFFDIFRHPTQTKSEHLMNMRRAATWVGVVLLSFSVGFISDISDNYFEISKNLDIFGRLYREVNTLYVEDTDPNELMRTGIDAMLASLDPYTTYISEDEAEDIRFMTTGAYAGVGALIGKREDRIVVLEPYQGYPADQAGLKAGDELIQVDDTRVNGQQMSPADVRNLLRGDKGSTIRLMVKRAGTAEPLPINITRDRIKIDNVPYYGLVDGEIGYLSLTGFTAAAGKEVAQAIRDLQAQQPNLQGLILDLRENPGGRLDEAVNVTNAFIPQKEMVVETRGRIEGAHYTHYAPHKAVTETLPLVVLINGHSASASEIVAGAIQDLDRGVIVGGRSFGKGLVQNIRPLIYDTQIKITTAKYYTPSGRCIQAINYAERDPDGSVSRIPDSLRSTFYTRNGRPVRDGGGIGPDVDVSHESSPLVAAALIEDGVIFEFVNQYVATHPTLPAPADFNVTDPLYQSFVSFAQSQAYRYQTDADRELDRLRAVVAEESYAELLGDNLDAISRKLDEQKAQDLNRYRAAISLLLEKEIVTRYYYQAGAIEAGLDSDLDIKQAVQILRDRQRYEAILQGEEK